MRASGYPQYATHGSGKELGKVNGRCVHKKTEREDDKCIENYLLPGGLHALVTVKLFDIEVFGMPPPSSPIIA